MPHKRWRFPYHGATFWSSPYVPAIRRTRGGVTSKRLIVNTLYQKSDGIIALGSQNSYLTFSIKYGII